jgi:hypothetical protein
MDLIQGLCKGLGDRNANLEMRDSYWDLCREYRIDPSNQTVYYVADPFLVHVIRSYQGENTDKN